MSKKPVRIPQDDLSSLFIEEEFTVRDFSITIKPEPGLIKKTFRSIFPVIMKEFAVTGSDNPMDYISKIVEKILDDYPAILEAATGIDKRDILALTLPKKVELVDKILIVNEAADEAFKKKCSKLTETIFGRDIVGEFMKGMQEAAAEDGEI